jgi:carboxypeptidase B
MEAHNKKELHDLAKEYSTKTKAVNNEFYRYGEGADIFGAVSGGSDDWAHKAGIPISYTIELRDRGQFQFALPESMIEPTLKENMEGIRAVYDHVRAKVTPDDTTTKKKTTTEAPKTTEAPEEENDCACFDKINVQAAELRRDATLTCLEDKTTTPKPGHKLIYVIAECGNRKIKAKKIVCNNKNNAWVPNKNPFMKIINKKC